MNLRSSIQVTLEGNITDSFRLVITGNPGVGKHTTAFELGKILDFTVIDINDCGTFSSLCFEKGVDRLSNSIAEVSLCPSGRLRKQKIFCGKNQRKCSKRNFRNNIV